MNDALRQLLIVHEGLCLKPYLDTVGKVTIGIGRNLTDNGISAGECETLFENDVASAQAQLMAMFPDFALMSEARQNALTDMMFNLGASQFGRFVNMIEAIRRGDWAAAAGAMRHSLWAQQLPGRVAELAEMVEEGALTADDAKIDPAPAPSLLPAQ